MFPLYPHSERLRAIIDPSKEWQLVPKAGISLLTCVDKVQKKTLFTQSFYNVYLKICVYNFFKGYSIDLNMKLNSCS